MTPQQQNHAVAFHSIELHDVLFYILIMQNILCQKQLLCRYQEKPHEHEDLKPIKTWNPRKNVVCGP